MSFSSNWKKIEKKVNKADAAKKKQYIAPKQSAKYSRTTVHDLVIPGQSEITRIIALDCEMVGAGEGGKRDVLARVSIVNSFGNVLLDEYIVPEETIVDYRTEVSGIRPNHLASGKPYKEVRNRVRDIISKRIIVGHGLETDLKALQLKVSKKFLRDSAHYKPLLKDNMKPRSLSYLCERILGLGIQKGEHDSVEDARASLLLYKKLKVQWEKDINAKKLARLGE